MKIVEALSKVTKGITRDEVCRRTGIASSGELTKKLRELENCGFIRKYVPFGFKEKNSLYQLIDNYTLFYYKFLRQRSFDENYWKNQINTPKLNAWSGISFEKVCLEHIPQLKRLWESQAFKQTLTHGIARLIRREEYMDHRSTC